MKKVLALIVARNKEFYRDRSMLAWTLLFPFIVLAGFTYGYSGRTEPILRFAVVPQTVLVHPGIQSFQKIPGLERIPVEDETKALRKLERYELDLVIAGNSPDANRFRYFFNAESDKGRLAESLLKDAITKLSEPRPSLVPQDMRGRRVRYADWLLPGLLAMNIMFGSMFGVGYVIVRYRKNGVLKRLRATPLSAFQFLTAQVLSRMLLMIVTSLMVVLGSQLLIGFKPQGKWIDAILFLAVSTSTMISLGLVIAARIASEEVADGILNLLTWPMIFLSGIWFSLDGASPWVLLGANGMPLTHVVSGLRAILIDGASLLQVLPQMGVLLCLSVMFIGIASAIFRWR